MKILHVDTGKEWRGGQSQVLMLSRGLLQLDHRSFIVTRKGSALAQRAKQEDLPVTELPFRFEADVASARALCRLAEEHQSAVVHAHTPHGLGLVVFAKKLGLRAAIVFTRRVSFGIRNRLINRWKLKQPQRVIAVSAAVSRELIKAGLAPDKIRVIHSSVDLDEFHYTGCSLERPFAIGIAGAMEKAKGIEQAMEFVLKTDHLPVQFHFAGEGPAVADMRSRFNESRVQAHGFVRDMSGFLRKMFAVFSFSPSEGFPNFLLQAMATGVPVVALKNEATEELLSSKELGLLFQTNEQALEILEGLIEETDSAVRIGAQASTYVRENYSSQEMVRKTLDVYKEIV